MTNVRTNSSSHTAIADFKGLPVIPPNDPSLNAPADKSVTRGIKQFFLAPSRPEGQGARVRRSIGTPKLRNFSPFLMLDHFNVGPGAGFPDHPHRGQETITYLLHGIVDHEDFAGNSGSITEGGLQFMTAGRGIMHSEIPRPQEDGSDTVGFQLWVDLPKRLKSCEPRYRDLKADEIPSVQIDNGNVSIKVISGQSHGVDSLQELAYTPVWLLDIEIKPGGKVEQPLPSNWNAFAYVYEGTTSFISGDGSTAIPKYHMTVFEQKGDKIVAEVDERAPGSAKLILVAGMPHDQRIVQYGPFVVTSEEEVYQAFEDFQMHKNGFERGLNWESEIAKKMIRGH